MTTRCQQLAIKFALSMAILMCACGNKEPPPPPPVKDTVFGDMVGAKDKARDEANKAMQQRKEQLDQALKKTEVE